MRQPRTLPCAAKAPRIKTIALEIATPHKQWYRCTLLLAPPAAQIWLLHLKSSVRPKTTANASLLGRASDFKVAAFHPILFCKPTRSRNLYSGRFLPAYSILFQAFNGVPGTDVARSSQHSDVLGHTPDSHARTPTSMPFLFVGILIVIPGFAGINSNTAVEHRC